MIWWTALIVGVTVALINTQLRGEVLRHALATTGARALVVGSEPGDLAGVSDECHEVAALTADAEAVGRTLSL